MKIKESLNRFYVHDMEKAIKFYEKVFNEKCKNRFKYSQVNLELAHLGNILILSGSDEDLKEVRSGMNMTVKHFDGTIVEYVEHKTTFEW